MKRAETFRIDGILLVNKPKGLSSNAVLQRAKRLFGAKKAGHTGSLDPMATGMLPVCFGEATKFCQYLLDADKCYDVTGLLGVKTNTGDAMGEVISQTASFFVSEHDLQSMLSQFTGQLSQIPSMFSALKHQGTPLYKYARVGVDIERKARNIVIHELVLHRFDGFELDLTVTCSKGTYIRNLIEDIGDRLGVGAHVTKLHRCHTAGFAKEQMYTLDELGQKSAEELLACLLPMERAVQDMPKLALDERVVQALQQGKQCQIDDMEGFSGDVRLYEQNGRFIGLGVLQLTGVLCVKRLLSLSPCF